MLNKGTSGFTSKTLFGTSALFTFFHFLLNVCLIFSVFASIWGIKGDKHAKKQILSSICVAKHPFAVQDIQESISSQTVLKISVKLYLWFPSLACCFFEYSSKLKVSAVIASPSTAATSRTNHVRKFGNSDCWHAPAANLNKKLFLIGTKGRRH